MAKFTGTGVAIVTPFDPRGNIDYKSLAKIIEHIISGKCEYIVAMGTTGESVTLTKDEKLRTVDFIAEKINKRVPLVLGLGGNNTQEIINGFKFYNLNSIDAILSVSPYYSKPSQRGIYEHYKAISEASPLPLMLYNVPGRTSSNILADTTLKLASDCKNILATKEASGNFEQIMRIIKYKPENFMVISGDDLLALPVIASGGGGVISVVANAFPYDFSEMTRMALRGNMDAARRHHYKLTDIIEQIFADGSPAGIKEVLGIMQLCHANVRLPLVRIGPGIKEKLQNLVQEYKQDKLSAA